MGLWRSIVLLGNCLLRGGCRKTHLAVGSEAPDFSLPSTSGGRVKLSDFRCRKTVVLAFVLKAFTPG